MPIDPFSEAEPSEPLPFSTGSLRLDLALGGGVLPGDVIEIFGPPESGKTTLCLHLAAAANRLGEPCVWLDADALLDRAMALRCGADPQLMLVIPPLRIDVALDILARLAASGAPTLIVIDSLTGLLGFDDAPPENETTVRPLQPDSDRLLSLALRRISQPLQRRRLSLVFTRRSTPAHGPAYHQLSARLSRLAPRLYTSARIRLGTPSALHQGRQIMGQQVAARVQRLAVPSNPQSNLSIRKKFPPCYGDIVLDIMYNQDIVRIGEIFDLGLQVGLINFRDGAFIVEHRVLGPDRAAAITALERLGLAAQLEQVIRLKLLRNESLNR